MGWLKRWDERNQRSSEELNRQAQSAEASPDGRRSPSRSDRAIDGLYRFKAYRAAVLCYLGVVVLIVLGIRWVVSQI